MGMELASKASQGFFVVTTHSDHILNGIRVAVAQGKAAPESFRILFFREGDDTTIDEPRMHRGGRIDYWPAGFFDMWDNAINMLLDYLP